MIRVIVADDHPIVRAGVRQILERVGDIAVVGEAGDGAALIRKASAEAHDLVLLDISMPGRDGIDVLKQLKYANPKTRVLIMSIHPEEQFAIRALKAGADGYLTKESVPEELVNAVRKVVRGGKYISDRVAEQLVREMEDGTWKPPHSTLSDREFEVFLQIAAGKSLTQIAEDLSLSVKTIGTYRTRILAKMNMSTNAEIIRYAIHHGL
jgi:two-component system invasion response regulator UvrY